MQMFVSTHYAGKDVMINFDEGETYKKVFGPVFVYLNSVSSKKFSHVLWSDAVRQVLNKYPLHNIESLCHSTSFLFVLHLNSTIRNPVAGPTISLDLQISFYPDNVEP